MSPFSFPHKKSLSAKQLQIDGKPRKSPRKPQPNPKYLAILGDKNNKSPAAVQEELMQKS